MLKILIISEHMKRANRVLREVYLQEENHIIPGRVRNTVVTNNVVYKAIVADKDKLKGNMADQIILDFGFYHELRDEVQHILEKSCVPEEFQIIDDRNLL